MYLYAFVTMRRDLGTASFTAEQMAYVAGTCEWPGVSFTAGFAATFSPHVNSFIDINSCDIMCYKSGREDLNLRPHDPESMSGCFTCTHSTCPNDIDYQTLRQEVLEEATTIN